LTIDDLVIKERIKTMKVNHLIENHKSRNL